MLDPEATASQRRADAFALLLEAARGGIEGLAAEVAEAEVADERDRADRGLADTREGRRSRAPVSSRADRFQVVVHVSAETLRASGEGTDAGADVRTGILDRAESRIEGGPRVSAETARRLCCDAGIVVMTHDADGNVLDVGRRTRSVPTPIRRALDFRDDGCRFPGCWSRICDAHHLHHWADGGATKLDNLVLLCSWHHRRVHEDGWRVETDAAGELRFMRPDGRRLPEVPPRPEFLAADADDAADALELEQQGLDIDPWTPTTRWLGDPFDVDWALFTLRPPAELEWVPTPSRMH